MLSSITVAELLPSLYRTILRKAKRFDRFPALKAVWKPPTELKKLLGPNFHGYYTPEASLHSLFRQVARKKSKEHPLDLAFSAIRTLDNAEMRALKAHAKIPPESWRHKKREAPAKASLHLTKELKAGIATMLHNVLRVCCESHCHTAFRCRAALTRKPKGSALIAHPCNRNRTYHRSVMLIISCTESEVKGVMVNSTDIKLKRGNEQGVQIVMKSPPAGAKSLGQSLYLIEDEASHIEYVPLFNKIHTWTPTYALHCTALHCTAPALRLQSAQAGDQEGLLVSC